MGTMREAVHERVENFRDRHSRSKEAKYGFLVRPLTLTLGWTILIVGLITIPLPGQGWLTTFVGIGILSLEVHLARHLLEWGVHQYDRFFDWFGRQSMRTRALLITLLIVIIWLVFALILWGSWATGYLDFLNGFFAWLGITRPEFGAA
ncbi:TIGR02611 family protein [Corynebacterium striatum]|nr:TIGR02611 family protein [Corynebacterium striatum]